MYEYMHAYKWNEGGGGVAVGCKHGGGGEEEEERRRRRRRTSVCRISIGPPVRASWFDDRGVSGSRPVQTREHESLIFFFQSDETQILPSQSIERLDLLFLKTTDGT